MIFLVRLAMEIIMLPELVKDVKCFGPCITIRNFLNLDVVLGDINHYCLQKY